MQARESYQYESEQFPKLSPDPGVIIGTQLGRCHSATVASNLRQESDQGSSTIDQRFRKMEEELEGLILEIIEDKLDSIVERIMENIIQRFWQERGLGKGFPEGSELWQLREKRKREKNEQGCSAAEGMPSDSPEAKSSK